MNRRLDVVTGPAPRIASPWKSDDNGGAPRPTPPRARRAVRGDPMSRPFPDHPFLQGPWEPWPMEGEIHDLVVEGESPRDLCGTLYRNGPNQQFSDLLFFNEIHLKMSEPTG